MMRVAILDDYQKAALRLADWGRLHPDATIAAFPDHISDEAELAHRLHTFECVVLMRERTQFRKSLIERLPNLRLIVTAGMRNAAIDVDFATERKIQVCGTEMLGYPTAELTWGLVLGLFRRITAEHNAMHRGHFQTPELGLGLSGKTLGILGLGRLGGLVAKYGNTFGMKVIAWSQNLTDAKAAEHGARRVEKDTLFAESDVVSIHLVLSPRSRGLVGAAELGRMKKTAFLVNTSRGPIVDERALLDCLKGKHIAGAALDVYDIEPLPKDHPVLALDNVLLTPHLGYCTAEGYERAYANAVEDIRAFLDGKVLRPVNELR
ncbi:MAG TPA: D-2-hydroxyacid dehydrogenase family protein [Stellaceae bacterium]|nr:D-2-hydroxyacid dehydrogenase family protein [Stellaceae bacterium]